MEKPPHSRRGGSVRSLPIFSPPSNEGNRFREKRSYTVNGRTRNQRFVEREFKNVGISVITNIDILIP